MDYRPDMDALRDYAVEVGTRSARDLMLLKAISETIDSLILDQKVFGAFADFAVQTAEKIKKTTPTKQLDPDGESAAVFKTAQESVARFHGSLVKKRQSALDDHRLLDDDGVAIEYGRLIEIVASVHEALTDLCWAFGEHDADLEPVERFDSIESMLAALKA